MWTNVAEWSRWWKASAKEDEFEGALRRQLEVDYADALDLTMLPDSTLVLSVWASGQQLVRARPDGSLVGVPELVRSIGRGHAISRLVSNPTGTSLAAIGGDTHVSVYDAVTLERRWTRIEATTTLAWSSDGTKLIVAGLLGGAVIDAATGELEFERRDLGLDAERAPNVLPEQVASHE